MRGRKTYEQGEREGRRGCRQEKKELEIAHRGGKKDGRRGGGKLQVDGLNFKAAHPAEVCRLTT